MKTNINKVLAPPEAARTPKSASGGRRILALLMDLLVVFGAFHLFKKMMDVKPLLPMAFHIYSDYLLIFYIYFTLTIIPHAFFGQTMGKFVMKIKLVTADSFREGSIFNVLVRDLLLRPFAIITPWSLFSKSGKATHDKIAKTIVVELK